MLLSSDISSHTCTYVFQDDELFLQQLFSQIQDDKVDDSRRRDLVFFLKEFCTFSQTLQPQGRETFFKVRFSHNFTTRRSPLES